ncbi:hypothetical protein D5086_032567 [Populus alba]|uniref:Uncharacterized protein n=1 Tax=Populus alba TaxID=43335 RepID=A0ACC4ALR3_POPAL
MFVGLTESTVLKERKLYRGSMRKMGSSSAEDIPANARNCVGVSCWLKWFSMEKVVPDSRKGLVRLEGQPDIFWSQKLKMILNCVEFLDKEEPDASTPSQVFEDMLEDNISSRNGNLIVPDLGAEVMSDVTSSSGPMKLEDLQRILSNIGAGGSSGDPDKEDISDLLQSRPFRQQEDSFTYVLRTGQIDLSQFEINPSKCEWSLAPEPVA